MTRGHATPPATVGERIRADRLSRGLTQDELADALGTSRYQVIRWEGNRNTPEGYAPLLADFFHRPAEYFTQPDQEPTREELLALRDRMIALVDEVNRQLEAIDEHDPRG